MNFVANHLREPSFSWRLTKSKRNATSLYVDRISRVGRIFNDEKNSFVVRFL